MCGRFTVTPAAIAQIADLFGVDLAAFGPLFGRWNVAPTQDVAAVRAEGEGRRLDMMRWGLLPPWTQDPKKGPLLINARADTVLEKPSFRGALRRQRCLIPADGFYEWAPAATPKGKKQPWWFRVGEGELFGLAGLWETWTPPEGPPITSFTLITTDANAVVAPVHDRMPVIVPPEAHACWLDPREQDPARILPLLRPYPAALMTATAVSQRLNSAREDDPSLVQPDAPPQGPLTLF